MGNPKDWFRRIAIVRSEVKEEFFPAQDSYLAEKECIKRSELVKKEIEKLGIPTTIIVADSHLIENLNKVKPDLCFNFADSVRGSEVLCPIIPGIFDYLDIPYAGADTLCLSLNCNKYLTKTLLEAWEIPTPQYQLIRNENQEIDYDLRFPLILKLNEEHGGIGVSEKSVVTNKKEFKKQVKYLIKTYKQHILAEEFIEDATELTAFIVEKEDVNIFLSERIYTPYAKRFKLLTFDLLYDPKSVINYKKFTDKMGNIQNDIKLAFEILKMHDYARYDVILDKYGNHYLIDCNTNPSLNPGEDPSSGVMISHGYEFKDLLTWILYHKAKSSARNTRF